MATQADVRRIALALPGVVEGSPGFGFSVPGCSGFCWSWKERVEPNKPRVPNASVLAVRVAGADAKATLLEGDAETFFTEPHYNGFPAVLVRLPAISIDALRLLLTDAWRCTAPKAVVKGFDQPAAAPKPKRATKRKAPARQAAKKKAGR